MTRPEGLSPINPGAPTSGQSLSLKEIERMLEELALSLVKEAHDAASRQKAMAALHKLARLKLDQRRMDLLEEEHRRRRQEMELKRQQAENKQAKGTSKTVVEAAPRQVNPGANSQAETTSYHTAVHETTGTVPAPEAPAAETAVKATATKNLEAAVQAPSTEGTRMNVTSPAPVASPALMLGNEKEQRRARMRARKADKKAARERKKREQMAARSAASPTQTA